MASTRLRHAFKYPDEDNISEPEGIDEEEQEQLIAKLRDQDADNTLFYRNIFLALPFLVVLPYLFQLLTTPRLTTFIALSSLIATAYTLYFIPLQPESGNQGSHLRPSSDRFGLGPLQRYLVPLNATLASILALTGFLIARREGASQDGILGVLPLAVFVIAMLVRSQLRPVDVNELAKLRYDYKGA